MHTTDFEEWLNTNSPDDFEEAYCLWEAANGLSSGCYRVTAEGEKLFIEGYNSCTLALLSVRAIRAFKARIQAYNPDIELGWDGMLGYRRAIGRDD